MKKIDLTEKRFGRLTVIKEGGRSPSGRIKWQCQCDCGNICEVTRDNLRCGKTTSCGCKVYESRNFTHKMSKTRIYNTWCAMRARCNNPSDNDYKHYGALGIKVCDEWNNSFERFYEWSVNNGYDKALSIDRIDVLGDYEPSNCRWATFVEQQRNKRDTVRVEHNGQMVSLLDLCEEYGFPFSTIYDRYYKLQKNGETPTFENMFSLPVRPYNKKQITQVSLDGEVVKVWDSVREASEAIHRNHTAISLCLVGKSKTCAGYIWRYATDEDRASFSGLICTPASP